MPLLDLTDDDLTALSPAALDRLERAALVRFQTTRKFDHRQWDTAVELWNDAMPNERKVRHAYCVKHAHDWVELPVAGARMCRRCISYKVESPQ